MGYILPRLVPKFSMNCKHCMYVFLRCKFRGDGQMVKSISNRSEYLGLDAV